MKAKKQANSGDGLHFVLNTTGKIKIYVVILVLIQSVLGVTSVYYALFMKALFDAASKANMADFRNNAILFCCLVVVQIALCAVVRFLQEYAVSSYENILKSRLLQALLTRDYGQVTATHSGEWMNRLTSDTTVVAEGAVSILPGAVGMVVRLISAIAMLLYMAPGFAIILIPSGVLMIVLTYGFRKVMKKLHKGVQEADGKTRIFMQDHLGSLMVVKAFQRENATLDEAAEYMREHQSARMKRNHFSNFCNSGFSGIINAAYILGAIYGGVQIMNGSMTYGTLIAILQLIGQIQSPFANITGYLPKYYAMLASAERLQEAEKYAEDAVCETAEPELAHADNRSDATAPAITDRNFRRMFLENVSFSYPDEQENREAIRNLTIDILPHEMVAFTGPSGCGKSTVLKLLMALYHPGDGKCGLIDGEGQERPLSATTRSLFAYVPQGNQLMSGTIREIVTFGKQTEAGDEAIWQALKVADADTFVRELGEGLDRKLGERGSGLSEGQIQRIAIARAIYSKRPVLLLDEATASLDEKTEYQVLENIKHMTDQTVIIVTHRPAALEFCDRRVEFGESA